MPTNGKLFEKILCDHLTDQFIRVFFPIKQHDFMKETPTTTNLVDLINYAVESIKSGVLIDVRYTDFSKSIEFLIAKCKSEQKWVHTSQCLLDSIVFIQISRNNRKQYVNMFGSCSHLIDAM